MIIGCFLALGLLIAISLNPFLLTKKLGEKTSFRAYAVQSKDQTPLSTILRKQLDIFSKQVKMNNPRKYLYLIFF